MAAGRCEACNRVLPMLSRSDRRHCNATCRATAAKRRRRAARVQFVPRTSTVAKSGVGARGGPADGHNTFEQLEQAVRDATEEVKLVGLIAAAARSGSWRASAWLLERQFPERWGAGRVVVPDVPAVPDPNDPFREVDELAARRTRRPEGR